MLFSRLNGFMRNFSSSANKTSPKQYNFEHVFSFSFVKYIALLNRLKIYHLYGTSVIVPSSGILELLNAVPESTFLISSYIGLTGGIVLTMCTLPFRNIIGHLYISDDNEKIKISSVAFNGKRLDRIVDVEDWTPLLNMTAKSTDVLFLTPTLKDGTKYKLFIKFGHVKNARKMGQVLE